MPTEHEMREMDAAERELLGRRARPGAQIIDATGRLRRQPDVELEHVSDRIESAGANLHANRTLARMLAWAVPLGMIACAAIIAVLRWLL